MPETVKFGIYNDLKKDRDKWQKIARRAQSQCADLERELMMARRRMVDAEQRAAQRKEWA